MKTKLGALSLITTLLAAPLLAAEQTVTFSVPGMYCASCPFIVEAAMGEVEGVISVSANSDNRTALVVFDDEITSTVDIADASAMAGYEAEAIEAGS